MAIKLTINVSKKVPGPQEFSSVQASCSIEAECTSGDPLAEASALYRQAEAAVDQQLGLDSTVGGSVQPAHRRASHASPSGNGRGSSRAASAAQLTYLRRLLADHPGEEARILQAAGTSHLDQLDSRSCSAAIDRLKVVHR